MKLSFKQMLFLYGLKKLNGERTIYSLFHLWQGKKSSQTIQDVHLFGLGRFFSTDPSLTREELAIQAAELNESGLLKEVEKERYILTSKGEEALEEALLSTPIPPYVNGWKYGQRGVYFWERLSLAIQAISHLQQRETKYIPVQRRAETLLWVKDFLKKQTYNRTELAAALYKELTDTLDSSPEINPAFFVIRLSGAGHIGLTETQAAQQMNLERTHYHFHFLNIIHYLAAICEEKPAQYPLLSAFLGGQAVEPLTHTAKKTYMLLQQGFKLDDISSIRRLKQSTIEDHIVELALNLPQFTIDEYVCAKKQEQIREALKRAQTKQLREIRKITPEASYFEIRLVLAKYGDDIC